MTIAIAPKIAAHAANFSFASQTALMSASIEIAHAMITLSGSLSIGPNLAARAKSRAPIAPTMINKTFTLHRIHIGLFLHL